MTGARFMRRWGRFAWGVSVVLLGLAVQAAASQRGATAGTAAAASQPAAVSRPTPSGNTTPPAGVPVIYRGQELGRIYRAFGPYSPEERARTAVARIDWLVHEDSIGPGDLQVVHLPTSSEITVGDRVIWVVSDADAAARGLPREQVAEQALATIRNTLTQARQELSVQERVKGGALAAGLTLLLALLLWGVARVSRWLRAEIARRDEAFLADRGTNLTTVGVDWFATVVVSLLRVGRVVVTALLLVGWLQLVMTALPRTRPYARLILAAAVGPFTRFWNSLVAYEPNAVVLLLIVGVAYGVLRIVGAFFRAVGRGTITLSDFPAEWADPTQKLVRFVVIVIAFVAAFPYIPGSSAPAFQGVSMVLAFFLTLSSSAAISNAIAGVILTYTRTFQTGDRVEIADTTGDVIGKSLIVTRIRTIKNVVVSIPNALVLGARIHNFSTMARGEGVILHTSVTIGYDAPWRQVHELLVSAALATPGIESEPKPFVLQKALDDFYVSYEVNALTHAANHMQALYSALHGNIQDKFNEAGVEIMSPHANMLRDANKTTIPGAYPAAAGEPGAFRIRQAPE